MTATGLRVILLLISCQEYSFPPPQNWEEKKANERFTSIIMTGTSPFTTFQSPSFHSSSYLPKLEANFMRDFSCCGVTLPTLHDLLQHYEESHATKSPHQGHRPSQGESRAALAAAAIAHQQNQQNSGQSRGLQPDKIMDLHRKMSHTQPSHHHPDLDTIDDMEMDEPMDDTDAPSNIFSPQSRDSSHGGFGNSNQRVPQLNLSMLSSNQGFNDSQPDTPVASGRPLSLQNNPTVSSVNTPTLMANPLHNPQFRGTPDSSSPGTPAEIDESMIGGFGDLSMQGNNPSIQGQSQFCRFGSNDMVDLCIDEPAKRLFSPSGGFGSSNAHFKLSGAQYGPNSEIARRIREQQLLAGVPDTAALLPNEEPKPFRCPVIGCEKAYKNQNGLKYHKAVSTLHRFIYLVILTSSPSMVTTINNFTIMPTVHSRLSTPKRRLLTLERLAWRKRSLTDVKCVASGTRTSTVSNTTSHTLRHAIQNSSLLQAAVSTLEVSCRDKTSMLLGLVSKALAKKVSYKMFLRKLLLFPSFMLLLMLSTR